jgi:hypothetical protein
MTSKVLDYKRPGRVGQKVSPSSEMHLSANQNDLWVNMQVPSAQVIQETETPLRVPYRGPLDYPLIPVWLKMCEDDLERGRDKHEYTRLSPVFGANGCTRIDDIARMSAEKIQALADREGIDVTVGLVNRVVAYSVEDVARVKVEGKLML